MQVIKLLASVFFALACSIAWADIQYEQGQATLSYTGRSVPPAIRAQAIQEAEFKAIVTYYAKAGGSEAANFDSIRDKVSTNLDRYVLDGTVIEEQDRKEVHEYTVSLRAKLNISELDNAMKATSGLATASMASKSQITFLVVGRQTSSQTNYDASTNQRADTNAKTMGSSSLTQQTSEGETVSKGQVGTNGSKSIVTAGEATSSLTTERGGSTTRRAADYSWRIFPNSGIDQVLMGAFHQAGFRTAEAIQVEPYSGGKLHVVAAQADYQSGSDLTSQTLQDVQAGLRKANIRYLMLGTLDVGLTDRDPATGLLRVPVVVNAKVLDLNSMIPDTVAVVGPVTYPGLGPTDGEAQINGLKLAAQNAAKDLISQLNSAGVH